ncbi:hypothetical protein ACLB2K_031662 [Fragaria x ananassa]
MGCGGVGCQLLQHIVSCRPLHAKQGIHLRVVGVSDSKSLVVASDVSSMGLSDNSLLQLCRLKSDGQVDVFTNPESIKKITDIAALVGKSTGLALVDCSVSSETIPLLTQAVDLGCCIVMANKKPLTSTMEDYDKLISRPRHIRHESTVGAGLPVISSLHRVLSSGDHVRRIIGSLSGTLGYVMSEVEDGKPISEVVRSAKNLGYTEPGFDTC